MASGNSSSANKKVAGTDLAFGVTASGIQGIHEQSQTKSAAGEIKVYKDKDGNSLAAYVFDAHQEISGEALVESSVDDKEIGDETTIGGVTGIITKWEVIESNEDVKKVSYALRTLPGLVS